jgi:putative ABC transport system permease protein
VALLSYGLWQDRFGGAPDVVGRHIRCDGKDCEIVGIMPPGFNFRDRSVQLWIPLALEDRMYERHDTHFLSVVARLKPGVSIDQARQEVDSISARYRQEHPSDAIARGANALRLQDGLIREERRPLLLLLAAVGCVLLIACVNVANLLLARTSGRAREIAIRAASGGRRARLARLFLTESVLLSLCGAGVGLLFALAVAEPLAGYAPMAGGFASVQLDARVFLFAVSAALATGVAAGLFPAMQFSRGDLANALREGGRSSTHGRAHSRFRSGLAAIEVALSLVLVIAAGLLLRSFTRLLQVNPGVRTDHTITLMIPWLDMPRDRAVNLFRGMPQRLGAIPGVISAGLTNCLPVAGHCNDNAFYIEGRPNPPGQFMDALQRNADPGYFAAIGLPLLRGRTFTEEDGIGDDRKHPRQPVVIVSESLVKAWFRNEDPIGRRLFTNSALVMEHSQGLPAPHYEIVGVVGDVPDALDRPAAPTFYMPLTDNTTDDQVYAVLHTAGEPHAAISAARAEISRLNPDLAVDRIRTVRDLVGESAAWHQFQMVLFGCFAALALVLAAFGLYGVLSYAVSQRRGEIGVRMALGAGRAEVAGLVLREGLEPVLTGVAIGLPAAFFACRLLRSLLFGVAPNDLLTFAAAPLVLVAVAALACYLPALRAARIDPAITLRGD